ncbi:MAG: tetratricopeptide repeat protein [Pseudomonadota bacterium]
MNLLMACALLSLLAMAWLTRPLWRSSRIAAIGLSLLLPAAAVAAYFWQGSWRTQQTIEQAAAHPENAQALMIEGMVRGLAAKLEKQPDNVEGWGMLGRSYFVLQRHADAAAAYAKANALTGGSNAEFLVSEAENLALANDRVLAGRPTLLFAKALKLAPDHPRALWFSGLAAAQTEDYKSARRHWQRLLKQDLPDSFRADLQQRLDLLPN